MRDRSRPPKSAGIASLLASALFLLLTEQSLPRWGEVGSEFFYIQAFVALTIAAILWWDARRSDSVRRKLQEFAAAAVLLGVAGFMVILGVRAPIMVRMQPWYGYAAAALAFTIGLTLFVWRGRSARI